MTTASPAPAQYAPAPEKNTAATLSLVFGIISIFLNILLIPTIVGLITGIVGIRRPFGRTKALVGIILSIVGAIIGIIVTVVVFGALGAASNAISSAESQASQIATAGPDSASTAPATTAPSSAAADASAPKGYTNIGDDVYFKYGTKKTDEFETIQNYTVIAKNGCSNGFYVEANEIGKGGDIVGYTNDTVGSLPAGSKYKGKFNITDDGVKSLKITKETCY